VTLACGCFRRHPLVPGTPFAHQSVNFGVSNMTLWRRFLGLSAVGNPEKQKWIYAFNITPRAECDPALLIQQPPGTTPSPLGRGGGSAKRAGEGQSFFFGNQGQPKRPKDGGG